MSWKIRTENCLLNNCVKWAAGHGHRETGSLNNGQSTAGGMQRLEGSWALPKEFQFWSHSTRLETGSTISSSVILDTYSCLLYKMDLIVTSSE